MQEYPIDLMKFTEIFAPGLKEKVQDIFEENTRFAYYTRADTAIKIIRNRELWLRNATAMNDFTEIAYGLSFVNAAIYKDEGASFRETIEDIFSGTIDKVVDLLNGWVADWQLETYLACISQHEELEDTNGRLSMWRAYGDTALIIKNTPLMAITDLLAVYSLPVFYLDSKAFWARLAEVNEKILINRKYLLSLGQETLVAYIKQMFFIVAISTKHPGFSEEREWRIFYRPNERKSTLLDKRVVVLDGIPQVIYALPLRDDPENGLHGADIPNLLDRVIIGPTQFPYISKIAFECELAAHKIENASERIRLSEIPLRSG